MLGVTKYFYTKAENSKKFLYSDDYEFLKRQMDNNNTFIKKSIDAQIMDLADEIAYAAHDLEDAISFGFVSLSEIMHEFDISNKYQSASEQFNKIAYQSREIAVQANRLNTSEEYLLILKKELTSNIVYTLMGDIGKIECQDGSEELGYKTLSTLAEGLKKLVFKALLRKKMFSFMKNKENELLKDYLKFILIQNLTKTYYYYPQN